MYLARLLIIATLFLPIYKSTLRGTVSPAGSACVAVDYLYNKEKAQKQPAFYRPALEVTHDSCVRSGFIDIRAKIASKAEWAWSYFKEATDDNYGQVSMRVCTFCVYVLK